MTKEDSSKSSDKKREAEVIKHYIELLKVSGEHLKRDKERLEDENTWLTGSLKREKERVGLLLSWKKNIFRSKERLKSAYQYFKELYSKKKKEFKGGKSEIIDSGLMEEISLLVETNKQLNEELLSSQNQLTNLSEVASNMRKKLTELGISIEDLKYNEAAYHAEDERQICLDNKRLQEQQDNIQSDSKAFHKVLNKHVRSYKEEIEFLKKRMGEKQLQIIHLSKQTDNASDGKDKQILSKWEEEAEFILDDLCHGGKKKFLHYLKKNSCGLKISINI